MELKDLSQNANKQKHKTSIVILTYNNLNYTKLCLESIRKHTIVGSYEVIIVDNDSKDGTIDWLKEQKDIKLILNKKNLGFPKGCNQGICISEGDTILLLNNDVVVTKNWLNNMITALYSSEEIGAVGPVTNSSAYYQSISVNYNNLDEMQVFAEKFNKLNDLKWEERLKLIGFCMLIKKKVIEKIGLLDEDFTPGNYEDDDYSIRLRKAGYTLFLCKDTFIHHYGGMSFKANKEYSQLLMNNERKFIEKWGFCSRENMNIHRELVDLIEVNRNEKISILDIGCGCGGTLYYLKNKFPSSILYGIDKNKNALVEAAKIAKVYDIDVFREDLFKEEVKFDYIMLHNDLVNEYGLVLINSAKKYLKTEGKLLFQAQNPRYYLNLCAKLNDKALTNENVVKEFDTLTKFDELYSYVLSEGTFSVSGKKIKADIREGDIEYYNILTEFLKESSAEELQITHYLLSIQYIKDEGDKIMILPQVLQELDNEMNMVENTSFILRFLKEEQNLNLFLSEVDKSVHNKIEILNYIASKCYENQAYDVVIPILQFALEYDEENKDTLVNLSVILNECGEIQLAIEYLEKIKEKDAYINELIVSMGKNKNIEIKSDIPFKENRDLKFLLRRVENDIEAEESMDSILKKITEDEFKDEEIIQSIMDNIIEKEKVLNLIGVKCFENQLYENVIPYFQKSYEIDEENIETIYNLGYVLYNYGEKKGAFEYLKRIENVNPEIDDFIAKIKEELKHE